MPILYDGDPQWYGNLVSQDDGLMLKTSIPLHLDFARKRKSDHKVDFAQVVRLAKAWAKYMKSEREGFRFKSFMIELIFAHLSDTGHAFNDYPEALQNFFTYIAKTALRDTGAYDIASTHEADSDLRADDVPYADSTVETEEREYSTRY